MSIADIFDTMDYGTAPEDASEALAWIVDQGGRFGHFIDGAMTDPGAVFESCNPATGEVLAHLTQATQADVDAAVKAARRAQPKWEAAGGPARARNAGSRHARGPILAFVDDDVLVHSGWLAAGLEPFSDPTVGGVEGRTEAEFAPASLYRFNLDNLHGGVYATCNMFYRQDLFAELGGFHFSTKDFGHLDQSQRVRDDEARQPNVLELEGVFVLVERHALVHR